MARQRQEPEPKLPLFIEHEAAPGFARMKFFHPGDQNFKRCKLGVVVGGTRSRWSAVGYFVVVRELLYRLSGFESRDVRPYVRTDESDDAGTEFFGFE